MKSSGWFDKTPVRLLASVLLFFGFVFLIAWVLYSPYQKPFALDQEYSMVFVGASVFTRGIDPEKVDAETGESSYVLASKGAPVSGRYEMLKAALDNPNIRTVVIEASYYTMVKRPEEYTQEERLLYFPKIMGLGHKADAAIHRFSFWEDEYDPLFGQLLFEGIQVWQSAIIPGGYEDYVQSRGFTPYRAVDQSLKAGEILISRDRYSRDVEFPPEVQEELESMLLLCRERGVRTYLVTMPMSQRFLWESTGMDAFRHVLCRLADQYQVAYYDFNLLEGIGTLLEDSVSFHDEEHLSGQGAEVFSPVLGKILREDIQNTGSGYSFFESYEEAKAFSAYQQ